MQLRFTCTIFISICSLLLLQNRATANIDSTKDADEALAYKPLIEDLIAAENHSFALELIQRSLFSISDRDAVFWLHMRQAECHMAQNQLSLAHNSYSMALYSTDSVALQDSILLVKALAFIKQKRFQKAKQDLFMIETMNGSIARKMHFYLGICYYGLNQFAKAETTWHHLGLKPQDSLSLHNITNKAKRKINERRLKRISRLSYFIPGSAQILSGDIVSGVNSVVLLGGLTLLYLNTALNYGLGHALLSVSPWFIRYYMGGVKNARESAQKRQNQLKSRYFQLSLQLVSPYL